MGAEIELRKKLVEDWYKSVKEIAPDTEFVIECSVYPEDEHAGNNRRLYPNIPVFGGDFSTQGGRSGGRAFPLEAFQACGEQQKAPPQHSSLWWRFCNTRQQ